MNAARDPRRDRSKDWHWLWYGGRPSVDLLNTLRDRKSRERELLIEPDDLADWLVAAKLLEAKLEPGVEVSPAHVAGARALRDAIDRLTFAQGGRIDAADVSMLNAFAKVQRRAPELAIAESGSLEVRAARDEDPVAVALGRVAMDAIDLVTSRPTVRICASEACGLRFEDRSPAQNRQWCSMKRCGNREKARQHYLRKK